MISQACATSVAAIHAAASSQQGSATGARLVITTDRTCNGPHLVYPRSAAAGGTPESENWVLDSFERDPVTGESMLSTAERVAAEGSWSKDEFDQVTVRRYEQYEDSLRQDRAFQRKWMVPITVGQGRRAVTIDAHVGVRPVRSDSARELKAVLPDGVISYASQTHPADGTAGMIVTAEAQARELGADGPFARVLASGFARVAPGTMPKAPVPAAIAALDAAGIRLGDVDVIKTHNPFVVNDLWFARELGADVAAMNPYGCSLIYGHPQGPTGARAVVELSMHLRSAAAAAGCSPAAPPVIPARPWSSRCSTRLATSPGRKRELRTAAPARRGKMTGSPDEWAPHYTDICVSPVGILR